MFKTVHIVPKLNAATCNAVIETESLIKDACDELHLPVVERGDIKYDTLVIAVGGDGTMLEAIRRSASVGAIALGINLGRIGFLTDIDSTSDLRELLRSILLGEQKLTVQKRMLLATDAASDAIACNEVAVSSVVPDEMIVYRLSIDGHNAGVHRANAIMASTATGSTAYALSAGGSLMMPNLEAIQIVPVAATTMTSRPIVVSPNSVITLEILDGEASVRADGQRVAVTPKQTASVITITKHHLVARVAHLEGWNYFDTLTKKLGWVRE